MFTHHRHFQSVFLLSSSCLKLCTASMAEGIYIFLTFSCYQRRPLFNNATRCDLFPGMLSASTGSRYVLRPEAAVLGGDTTTADFRKCFARRESVSSRPINP